ncbi:MAG TPA: polyprenyl synthetase family protein [Gammaproteobacteria bacterium]|nr:polyprenyl synthetase family protein [Gammaproteobacteria bacterium]
MLRASASPRPGASPPDLDAIRGLIAEDMQAADRRIRAELTSDVALINQLADYIIAGGGKRLRPLLVLLSARACGVRDQRHVDLAAIIEFIHTATLLHDDVVDASNLRRGRETANAIWGNEASVLVGDFLYSRAFQMMVRVNDMRVMGIMADATNLISEGEVLQLMNVNDPDTTEARYLDVIRRKTATLFEAGARLGAVIAERSQQEQDALGHYGLHLGIAFQLVDDMLDYGASAGELGKNIGDDLAEGKPTLPLIQALHKSNPSEQALIRSAIVHGGLEHIDDILAIIQRSGALEYTLQKAREAQRQALDALGGLPASRYLDGMKELAEFAIVRRS